MWRKHNTLGEWHMGEDKLLQLLSSPADFDTQLHCFLHQQPLATRNQIQTVIQRENRICKLLSRYSTNMENLSYTSGQSRIIHWLWHQTRPKLDISQFLFQLKCQYMPYTTKDQTKFHREHFWCCLIYI